VKALNHLLEVKDLVTCFHTDDGDVTAVDRVSLHIDRGEIIGLVGESGSGKSVTMMSIQQLISPPGYVKSGEVYLDGVEGNLLTYKADSEKMRSIRGGRISMIFQEPMTSLNPVLTIGYQIQENILQHTDLDPEAAKKKAIEMLKMVKIPDAEQRYNDYPQQFSGGMRQRIMIAIALSANPDLLIADEATTALDVTTQAQILEMIRSIAKKTNTAVIIVTHNLGIVARFAERIYVMYSGRVMETSKTWNIFKKSGHPYTKALLRAIPRLDDPKDRVLIPIDGLPPSPADRPTYCPFYKRCEYRKDSCKENAMPDLQEIGPDHYSACLLSQNEMQAKEIELRNRPQKAAPVKNIRDENVLEVEGVKKYFPILKGIMRRHVGDVKAIEDISYTLKKGETLGIVGESGCGKTTMARCVMRVYKPEAGIIRFNGIDIAGMKDKELAPYRSKIAMIFQDPFSSLDPRQTAGSIVEESLIINHSCKTEKERQEKVDRLFRLVGLDPSLKNRVPHEFSGGQRQRLGIARALSSDPEIIVCDEPISALDVSIQAQIINLLEEIQAKLGVSYIFIAHDLAVVKHISDRVLVMYLGHIVEIADCDELYKHPFHPYTEALLQAVPEADPDVEKTKPAVALEGEVPSIINRPAGCPFHNRCKHCMERCTKEVPQLTEFDSGHQVACFLFDKE
jgi:peptide/nickel transport system ATP-binding protein